MEKVPTENQERPAQIHLEQQNHQSSPTQKCFLGSTAQRSYCLCCAAAPKHGPCSPFSSHGLGAASFPGSTATAQHISDRSPKPWSHGPLPPGRVREGAALGAVVWGEDQQPPMAQQSLPSSRHPLAQGWELALQAVAVQTPPYPWSMGGCAALGPAWPSAPLPPSPTLLVWLRIHDLISMGFFFFSVAYLRCSSSRINSDLAFSHFTCGTDLIYGL